MTRGTAVFATIRAVVSLLALIGFYVFAVGLIAGIMIGAFQLKDDLPGMPWVIAVTAGAGLIVLGSLWTLATWRPGLQPGVDVTPEEAPELWALVSELSEATHTRGPEQVRLIGDVNAAVSEDARFFGLFGGPRRMYLGVPLLLGLSVSQLRAVLAHEFGHFSGTHTRLGPLAYRGWQAIVSTVQQLQGNVFQWPLRVYMVFYILLSRGMSRSQEREADRLMVQIDGRANAQAALREVYASHPLLVVLRHPISSVSVGDWIWRRPPMASSGDSTNCSSLAQTKSMRSAKRCRPRSLRKNRDSRWPRRC